MSAANSIAVFFQIFRESSSIQSFNNRHALIVEKRKKTSINTSIVDQKALRRNQTQLTC